QASSRFLRKPSNSRFEIVGGSLEPKILDLQSKSGGHVFNPAPYPGKPFKARVQNDRYSAETGRDLFEQLQPFATDFRLECAEPCNIASRYRETLHVAGTDWVDDRDEHDWDRSRCLMQCSQCWRTVSHDHVWCEGDEFGCRGLRTIRVACPPAS